MSRRLTALMALVSAGFLCAVPAAAKVVEEGEGSFVTRDSVTVKAAPYAVWTALITPNKWWSNSHTWSGNAENMYISAQAGGCFCELLPMPADAPEGVRRGSAHHMTVVMVDPPKALRMRGGLGPLQSEPVDGVLTITMAPGKNGTTITFEYVVGGYMRFPTSDIAKAVDGVMSQQLNSLAKLLGPVAPEPPAEKAEKTEKAEPLKSEVPDPKKVETVDEAFSSLTDDGNS